MSKMNFTADQQKAIYLEGDSLLVSAAAGSGKTAVLTERVVQKLCKENAIDADRLMILTFTIAAADEMRTRISKRLREMLLTHPNRELIRRQLSRLPAAQISTIHSACLAILRENFETVGLDPQFSVGDESRLALMKTDALSDFVEELYENIDTDRDAKTVIEAFCRGRDDNALFTALDKGSEFLKNQPYPELFINSIEKTDIINEALSLLKTELHDLISTYDTLIEDSPEKMALFLQDESDDIRRIYNHVCNADFDSAAGCAYAVQFKTIVRRPKDADELLWNAAKDGRTELKARFLELRDMFLYAGSVQVKKDRAAELPLIKSYLALCMRLNARLKEMRLKERLISFDDIEKYTLELLIREYDGEKIVKTELAQELSGRFEEIIVDEYQDCNTTQELIFLALSRDGKNIFTVGDVKQSIYRFRGAQPQLFLKKQRQSAYPEGDTLSAPSKLDLSCNFRSHGDILSFVNSVFYSLMTPSRGIDYRDGHELSVSSLYDETDAASVDMSLVVTSDSDKLSVASRTELEAAYVAKKIKEIIGNQKIYDAKLGVERAVRPSDIAVLMRAPRTCGMLFEKAIENEGLTCINNNPSEKYLDTPEVRTVIAYLQAIDNPYNDIPLITLMYSDYFGFDVNELGSIRAGARGALFYDAVKEYAKKDKKTADFVNKLSELRALSLTVGVYDLINAVFEKSGVLTRLSMCEGGDKKRANLMMLCDLAYAFESSRYRGLYAFISYLIKLAENDRELPGARLRADDDCISLLSIHASKGLEYPVVFLVNTGAVIRTGELDEILLDPVLGAGGHIRERDTHREFSGVVRNVIREHSIRDEINEYIRLLYVALTRPRCRLYITACLGASVAEKMIKACDRAGDTPKDRDILNSPSFFKWMLFSGINTRGADPLRAFAGLAPAVGAGGFSSQVISGDSILNGAQAKLEDNTRRSTVSKEKAFWLITREAQGDFDIPAKLSVSEIKEIADGDAQSLFAKTADFKKPRFLQGGVTGADRGSATHKFLQFCDFEKICDSDSFDKELTRLIEGEFITPHEGELTDKERIIRFLHSDIMKMLTSSGTARKEERFMFSIRACDILDTDSPEPIVIQGVLDCWYIIDGKAVIVDYKTDRVKSERELIDRYRVQLDMYERALLQNEGIATSHKYIYSFALEKFISL